MRPKSPWDYTILTLRVLLGVWLLLFGLEKVFRVGAPAFAKGVEHYQILVGGWNLVVAYLVPWVEIIAGLGLLTGWLGRGASLMALALTLVFIFVSAQAWYWGLPADCGCFGKLFKLDHAGKMLLLVVQLLVAGIVVATQGGSGRAFGGSQLRLP